MSAPFDPVGDILDAMIARLEAGFGFDKPGKRPLKTIEPLEFAFTAATETVVQLKPPALYVVPLGWKPTGSARAIDIAWTLYAVSDRATPHRRGRGGEAAGEIGVYEIAARGHALLNGWVPPVPDASALGVRLADNLSGMAMAKSKLAVIALTITGRADIGLAEDGEGLDDFLRFHADFDIAPVGDPPEGPLPIEAPDATVDATLPGAS